MNVRPEDRDEPLIARDATYHRAPDGLRKRVHAAAAAEGRARVSQATRRVFAWGAAFATVAVVSWNLALMQGLPGADDLVARDVLSAHMRSVMATGRLTDVPSTERHEVKPWFAGKLDYSPPVPDLSSRGFTLVGGRLDVADGRNVAVVTYRYRLHIVNVFEWPAKPAAALAPQRLSRQGYNMVHWARDGMEYWAVSDLAPAELSSIAE